MSDYHLHLHPHAGDTHRAAPPTGQYPPGLIESYVEFAAERGVTELGFTEHLYRCVEANDVLGPFWEWDWRSDLSAQAAQMVADDRTLSIESYVAAVQAAKERGLPVKLGLEVDFFPQTIDAVLDFLAPYPFDYLIGSVHWVGAWSIDSGDVTYEFGRRGVDQSWEDYFALVVDLAERGAVDVLAHVDVCKKYGYRPATEPTHLYERVVKAAARTGTSVEVSSQGLRRPVSEVYPSPTFLKMFHGAGVKVTLASDAHHPEDAGHAHDEVVEAARAAGYTEHLRFESRRPFEVPLLTSIERS